MRLHIQILHDGEGVQQQLHNHGWRLDRANGQSLYSARHPQAYNQVTARQLLKSAGLLTSSAVRIEFDPRPACSD
jgi:hypothetical protein